LAVPHSIDGEIQLLDGFESDLLVDGTNSIRKGEIASGKR
jgi:hypothetical protein